MTSAWSLYFVNNFNLWHLTCQLIETDWSNRSDSLLSLVTCLMLTNEGLWFDITAHLVWVESAWVLNSLSDTCSYVLVLVACELLVRVRRSSRFVPSIRQFIVTVYYTLINNDDFPVIIVNEPINYNYKQSKPILFLRPVLYTVLFIDWTSGYSSFKSWTLVIELHLPLTEGHTKSIQPTQQYISELR